MSDVEMQDESEESEELEQQEEEEEEEAPLAEDSKASEEVGIPSNAVQQSVNIHTDEDYDDDDDLGDEDDEFAGSGLNLAGHKRTGSMAEKRESIQKQKAAMEERLRTLSQNLDMNLTDAMDEFTEMEQINEDKTIFSDLFDKIDPDDNGDVDENEFIGGLARLNVQIEEDDMSKLFKLMDGDKSGYIDRQDWITFCMTTYQSKELQRLHDSVLSHIKGHSRKPSNMFHAQDSENWSASAINNLEKQMTQAFLKQGVDEMRVAEEEEEYFISMEKEAETNPQWAKAERALEWTPKEVAFWLDTIELGQYARKFDDEQVDGSILLNDCDRNLLQIEMQIKPLHVGKILREVDKLRKANKDQLSESYRDWNELRQENTMLMDTLQQKEALIKELQTEVADLRLKSMNNVMPNVDAATASASASQLIMDTADPMTQETTTAGAEEDDMADYKTDTEQFMKGKGAAEEIKMLQEEIEHLHQQKITFAENAATEICNLTRIIRVLSREYDTLSTPYYKKVNLNPVDAIIRSLGYTPNDAT